MVPTPPMLRLGDLAPDFIAQTTQGELALHRFIDARRCWAVLFSHPEDFTPVCTTELGKVAQLAQEWKKRNVQVIGLSCDDLENHEQWIRDINETQHCCLDFPIISDKNRHIATMYGMLDTLQHDATNIDPTGIPFTVRNVYIIDPFKKIRLILIYPASTGRNFDEILRVIDALQFHSSHQVTTPANWIPGGKTIVPPTMSTEEARQHFGEVEVVKPYLRFVNVKSPIHGNSNSI